MCGWKRRILVGAGRNPVSLANVRENFIPITIPQGTDQGFTMLPARLAEVGYISHQVGCRPPLSKYCGQLTIVTCVFAVSKRLCAML